MAKIMLTLKPSYKEVYTNAKAQLKDIDEWFDKNPDRIFASVDIYKGHIVEIRRTHILEDFDKAFHDMKIKGFFKQD